MTKCPKCGWESNKPGKWPRSWHCGLCRLDFDEVDDGFGWYVRPSKRIERQEDFLERIKQEKYEQLRQND